MATKSGTKNDYALAMALLNARDAYAWIEDPDSFHLGEKYFKSIGQEMRRNIQEIFNRIALDGREAHPSLLPFVAPLTNLLSAERDNAESIYFALCAIQREDIPRKRKPAAVKKDAFSPALQRDIPAPKILQVKKPR